MTVQFLMCTHFPLLTFSVLDEHDQIHAIDTYMYI